MNWTERDAIIKLNEMKHFIKKGDIVISKTYGLGIVEEVLYNEDVWNPIGVKFYGVIIDAGNDDNIQKQINLRCCDGKYSWFDATGGGTDTQSGDVIFYADVAREYHKINNKLIK